jgi:hypothetical protein
MRCTHIEGAQGRREKAPTAVSAHQRLDEWGSGQGISQRGIAGRRADVST